MGESPNKFDYFEPERKFEPKQEAVTVRLDLSLAPTESGYAEINYRELIADTSKKQEVSSGQDVSSSPFTDATSRMYDDIRYKTVGYDTTDSFIDDSEIFDEYVSPKPGGFYINYQPRGCKPIGDGSPAATIKHKVITVTDGVQDGTKENKAIKRKSDLTMEMVKLRKMKKINKQGDVQFIKEVIRKPFSPNMKKNPKYNVKSNDGKPSDNTKGTCPTLPLPLPGNLLNCIALLKRSAILSKSKGILLNENLKKLLIDFELQLLPFSFKVRSDIYTHLAYYFSLSPATLKRKSKTLVVKKLSDDIDEATLKLVSEIQKSSSQQSQDGRPTDFSPVEKDLLLSIFRLKKKLYDVQRSKTKSFLDHLAELIKEDILHMWLPSQMKLQLLVNLASSFYTTECRVTPQKVVKEKQRGSPSPTEKNT